MSFAFSLEALLVRRRAVENAKRQILAQAQQHLDELQRRLRKLESDFSRRVHDWDPDRAGPVAELERSIAEARAIASRCEGEVSDAREAVLEAMRDRKALELRKERRRAEFAAGQARKEERELDEANQS